MPFSRISIICRLLPVLLCLLVFCQVHAFAEENVEAEEISQAEAIAAAPEAEMAEPEPPVQKPKRDIFQELDPDNEISITANRMEMHFNEHFTELNGNVMIQTSVLILSAEKLRIYTDEENRPSKIEAESRVALRKLDGTESATGDRAEFASSTNQIILDGECTLMQGHNIMRCKRIIYDVLSQTVTAEGGSIVLPNLQKQIELRQETRREAESLPSQPAESAQPTE